VKPAQSGSALVVGLLLLSLITLLGLAGASAAQVELQLARNEQFRENAASAASAGIEIAIRHVTVSASASRLFADLPGMGSVEIETRLIGYETHLPQLPGGHLAGAHFEIQSTGHGARGAADRQRARVRVIVDTAASPGSDCEPVLAGVPCVTAGQLRRMSWQRLPAY
jgi:hypothetical protein